MFINIHTHNPRHAGEWSIRNIYRNFDHAATGSPLSMGLHPWNIDPGTWKAGLDQLKKYSTAPNVLAIGEAGLDKLCKTDWALQVDAFAAQLSWVHETRKPLIIHCVRAYDDILKMLKAYNIKTACIFHGFNRNVSIAKQIIGHGYYLSFGSALQLNHVRESLRAVPLNRIFLETDDAETPIAVVYQLAAETLGMSVDDVISQIRQNTTSVFGINIA
ncbi:MAG TPA: hypothetical protein DCQ34_11660 [Chitinophagaceae bacterium]|nr:hypothetical protein [Chitinophagaceae bacterium]HRF26831.1 TatD family hydrolase [Ferruginibacter sp.]